MFQGPSPRIEKCSSSAEGGTLLRCGAYEEVEEPGKGEGEREGVKEEGRQRRIRGWEGVGEWVR